MVKINHRGLEREIAYRAGDKFKDIVKSQITEILARVESRLVENFRAHPVTQEIEAGPSAANYSNTLGGNGNLFTFLGFNAGSDPIAPILSLLLGSINITSLRKKRNHLAVRVRFTVPTEAEIEAISPLPWAAGASWTTAIERGISNLGHYLYRPHSDAHSRSGGAIQVNAKVRSASSSSPVPYITELLYEMMRSIQMELKKL